MFTPPIVASIRKGIFELAASTRTSSTSSVDVLNLFCFSRSQGQFCQSSCGDSPITGGFVADCANKRPLVMSNLNI